MAKYFEIVFVSIIIIILNIKLIKSDLISDEIYKNISNAIPCVRRLNSTHQIGCGNLDESNYYGVIYLVNNLTDLNNINLININEISKKLIIVTIPNMFQQVVDYYKNNDSKNNKKINGIVLLSIDNINKNNFYSDDSTKPNQYFSYYKDKSTIYNNINWNKFGTSNMFENFKVPFYLVDNLTEIETIIDCYKRFNENILLNKSISLSNVKLCGMQIGLQMYAASNSHVCIRRNTITHTLDSATSFCDPLGGFNYFSFMSNSTLLKKNESLILLSTQIDSFTLFEYYTPGVSKPITSIISLLSIANLLSKYRKEFSNELLFSLFNNEAFDYAGSSRFIYDLKSNKFPNLIIDGKTYSIEPNTIKMIIELSEFGNLASNDTNKLWIHKDPITYSSDQYIHEVVDNITTLFETYSNNEIKRVTNTNQALPPSSIHSFLKHNLSIPSLLIADHEIEYKNNYFRSIYDKRENLNLEWPANITEDDAVNSKIPLTLALNLKNQTTTISKVLYSLLTDDKKKLNDEVDIKFINNLIYCFIYNPKCKFFASILSTANLNAYINSLETTKPANVLSFYTTVTDQLTSGIFITNAVFKYVTRERLADNFNQSQCNTTSISVKNLVNTENRFFTEALFTNSSSGSLCILSSLIVNSSMSPAFIKYIDGELKNTDIYSAWTESTWESKETQMKLFLFSTKVMESVTLTVGICVAVLSFVFTFLVNKYLSKWLLSGEEVESLNDNY